MEKRYEPIFLQRRAEGQAPFGGNIMDRCPWLELYCAIDSLAPSFFAWPRFLERDGDQIDEFRHAEVIFPADNNMIVVLVPLTEYGDEIIRHALELIIPGTPTVNVRLSLV